MVDYRIGRLLKLLLPMCVALFFAMLPSALKAQMLTTCAGNGDILDYGDGGTALRAGLLSPNGICLDAAGNLYITTNNKVRRVDYVTGIISTIAGTGNNAFSGDGGPALKAELSAPYGICMDAGQNIYITDLSNRIRKIDAQTGIITTIAGNGTAGYSGDGGAALAASLNGPHGVFVDKNNNVFIADTRNGRVRKIDGATGIITTVAGDGSGTFSGDGGPALSAGMRSAEALFVDAAGNIYVADNNIKELSSRIRKVTTDGNINSIAGNASLTPIADGGQATATTLYPPNGICMDAAGNLYFSEIVDSRIHKIDAATGVITIIAGDGFNTYNGDCDVPVKSSMYYPKGICMDAAGNMYVADNFNNRIRVLSATPPQQHSVINITASATNICAGAKVTFTAFTSNVGNKPVYQWRVNHAPVGTNTAIFTTSNLNDQDVVTCDVNGNIACNVPGVQASNAITISYAGNIATSVQISASQTSVCAGTSIVFTAKGSFSGATPTYQWLVNGQSTGTNNATFTTNSLTHGAVVQCMVTLTVAGCVVNNVAKSNTITIAINTPSVQITASANPACAGSAVTFTAALKNGGINPVYQWLVNGHAAGLNSPVFLSTTLSDGDLVSCVVYTDPNTTCGQISQVASNAIKINLFQNAAPTIIVKPVGTILCEGDNAVYMATVTNGGLSPGYQWQVNGMATGASGAIFSSASLNNNDVITCTVTPSNTGCAVYSPAISAPVQVTISPKPVITIKPAYTIERGDNLFINPTVSGSIASVKWTPSAGLSNDSFINPIVSPLTTTTYQLEVFSTNGCSSAQIVTINVLHDLLIPNGFSPNGDGINDTWKVRNLDIYPGATVDVFNRLGQNIFHSTGYGTDWDGRINGNLIPNGVYYYVVDLKQKDKLPISGSLTVIR